MAGISLKCEDCGVVLNSISEAHQHSPLTSNTHLNIIQPDIDLQADKTSAAENPVFSKSEATDVAVSDGGNPAGETSGNRIDADKNDPHIGQMPAVHAITKNESLRKEEEEWQTRRKEAWQARMKKQLEDLQAHMKKELEDMQARRKELEEMRARKEKEEWQARKKKELDDLQAHIEKEIEEMQARKEEEAVIRRISELPLEDPSVTKPSDPVQEEQLRMPVRPVTIAELMRECLWSLKKTHKDEDARVKRTFQTLHIYAGNVVKNPDEEKYRKIRLSNQAFKDRVGELRGGIEFLELCGFAKSEDGEYLYMPRDKVDITVLNTAGRELQLQIENPQLFV